MPISANFSAIPEKVFRDPVHEYIHIQHQVILDLIDTREFQRLRRIKQLGYVSYVFHGAVHNRFAHCLGTYEIARRICNHFVRNYPTKSTPREDGGWDDHERLVTLCAALLHDVGHGPFSHTFEKIFHTDHEAITREIILNEATEVHQVLAGVSAGFPNEVAAVINHSYPNPQVTQLISSQIDADRMDYLLRDSYYTGVTYGQFDLTRILRTIQPHQGGIRFRYAGMHAVEDYIVSRYQMYMQVYFHPLCRSIEVLLIRLLRRAEDLYATEPEFFQRYAPFLVPFFEERWTLADYLALDDSVLEGYFRHWYAYSDDAILRDLADRVLHRRPFKAVTYDADTQQKSVRQLTDAIKALHYDSRYYLAADDSYDLPYDLYHPEAKKPRTQIELIEPDGTAAELSEVSPLIKAFTGQTLGEQRLFFPDELYPGRERGTVNLFEPTIETIHRLVAGGKLH